jgi:Cytochrome oxidase complex assembly protein 1
MQQQLRTLRLTEIWSVWPSGRRHARPLTLSVPRNDIRFPHGVPAFPISPPKSQSTRPLPAYKDVRPKTTRNIVIFFSICGAWTVAALLAINYERFASPITASTLHEVRKSAEATALLGSDIQHRSMHPAYRGWYRYDGWFRQPWITGSIQLTKGNIDIAYDVKGSCNQISAESTNI